MLLIILLVFLILRYSFCFIPFVFRFVRKVIVKLQRKNAVPQKQRQHFLKPTLSAIILEKSIYRFSKKCPKFFGVLLPSGIAGGGCILGQKKKITRSGIYHAQKRTKTEMELILRFLSAPFHIRSICWFYKFLSFTFL